MLFLPKAKNILIDKILYILYYNIYRIKDQFTRKNIIYNYFSTYNIYKLQVGCGVNYIQGWLNTDINPKKNIIYLDASKKFPFDNNTFHYIFNEHLIEHISFKYVIIFLKECYRILKPGGKIRISTPDLNFLIELYGPNKSKSQIEYINWAANNVLSEDYLGWSLDTFIINNFFYNWGHKFIFDEKVLVALLRKCGFINIIRCNVGESDDHNLKNLEHHGLKIGEVQNRLESMVFEATKPNI